MEPIFSATLERLYRRLPEFIRLADPDNDWAVKRYLSLVGDQLGDLEVLLDRIDCVTVADGGEPGDSSELVDPTLADVGWLPWLAQLVSVNRGDLTPSALREAIADPRTGWQVGSQDAVIAAVQQHLTGTRAVTITRDYMGDQWRVLIETAEAETPRLTLDDVAVDFATLDDVLAAYATLDDFPDASVAIRRSLALQAPAYVQLDFAVV